MPMSPSSILISALVARALTEPLSLLKILAQQKSELVGKPRATSCDEPVHGAACTVSGCRAIRSKRHQYEDSQTVVPAAAQPMAGSSWCGQAARRW